LGAQLRERQAFSKLAKQIPPAVTVQPGATDAGTSAGALIGELALVAAGSPESFDGAARGADCSAGAHPLDPASSTLEPTKQNQHCARTAICARIAIIDCLSIRAPKQRENSRRTSLRSALAAEA
jgi:hypothetical protein